MHKSIKLSLLIKNIKKKLKLKRHCSKYKIFIVKRCLIQVILELKFSCNDLLSFIVSMLFLYYCSLYTLDGTRVERPDELESGQIYVAVGSELGGYQKLDYGRRKPQFNLSPKLPRR